MRDVDMFLAPCGRFIPAAFDCHDRVCNDAANRSLGKAMLKKSLIIAWMLTLFTPAQAQEDPPKPAKLFEAEHPIEVTLTGPWRQIMRDKDSEERFPGTFRYVTESGEERSMDVEFKTRGLTRRDKVCDFPPLKVYFDKKANKGTEFRGQSSLKLVTYCQKDKRFLNYNLLEFMIYRMYNLITPYSFRVRPLQATYQDEKSRSFKVSSFSFLIEDVDDLADRLDLKELSIDALKPTDLDPAETANYTLFQYMIGNLDWAATAGPGGGECCHNGKLIGKSETDRPVFAIPYDFDSSGLVDAHYAAPPQQLRIRSLKQRVYRGFCFNNDEIPATLERMRGQRDAIFALLDNEKRLSGRKKGNARRFLAGFYDSVESEENIQELIIDKCRG